MKKSSFARSCSSSSLYSLRSLRRPNIAKFVVKIGSSESLARGRLSLLSESQTANARVLDGASATDFSIPADFPKEAEIPGGRSICIFMKSWTWPRSYRRKAGE